MFVAIFVLLFILFFIEICHSTVLCAGTTIILLSFYTLYLFYTLYQKIIKNKTYTAIAIGLILLAGLLIIPQLLVQHYR